MPGFGLVDVERGLKCALCGLPTLLAQAEIYACAKCDFQEERVIQNLPPKADPTYCHFCNP